MIRVIVHNPNNEVTRNNKFYNYFFEEFTKYLRQFFIVEEDRYYSLADRQRYNIQLRKGLSTTELLECDYIIENDRNGEFVIMSAADVIAGCILTEHNNPYLKKVLVAQFFQGEIYYHVKDHMYKYSPWTYFQCKPENLDPYYYKRLYLSSLNPKLFFRGTTPDRPILNCINPDIMTPFETKPSNQYFNELISHKIALSVDGVAEFCYRDIECFAVGVPILRFEYLSKMYNELIPNYHYISVPRPKNLSLYRLGGEKEGKLIEERYNEVINDSEFLNFISKNARKYYEENCRIDNMIKNTFELLNLRMWL